MKYGCFGLTLYRMQLEADASTAIEYIYNIVFGFKSLVRVSICNKSNKLNKKCLQVELLRGWILIRKGER